MYLRRTAVQLQYLARVLLRCTGTCFGVWCTVGIWSCVARKPSAFGNRKQTLCFVWSFFCFCRARFVSVGFSVAEKQSKPENWRCLFRSNIVSLSPSPTRPIFPAWKPPLVMYGHTVGTPSPFSCAPLPSERACFAYDMYPCPQPPPELRGVRHDASRKFFIHVMSTVGFASISTF